jgi:hypothetical protein
MKEGSTMTRHSTIEREQIAVPDNDTEDNMVLRTVFLPHGLDITLREQAARQGTSKGELIRTILAKYLHDNNQPTARSHR